MGTYFAGLLVARQQGLAVRPPAAATRRSEPRDRSSTSAILSDSGELPVVAQRPRGSRDSTDG